MGITLGNLRAKLLGELNVIPASSAKARINDALRAIYDEVEWGFLFTDSYIRMPALIEGHATVLKFSDTITLDAPTKALVDAISPDDVSLYERQLRFIGSNKVDRGFTYKILDYDSVAGTMLIDPAYLDDDNANVKLQILKVYYTAPFYIASSKVMQDENGNDVVVKSDPVIDFKRFEYVVSHQFNRKLLLDSTPAELFRFDPYREFAGEPKYMVPYAVDSSGNQLYEVYPAPRFERVLRVKYLRAGLPLDKNSDQAPDMFSQELIITKAKIKSYEWAAANSEMLKLKSVGRFANLIVFLQKEYNDLLAAAKKNDEERYPKAYQGNFADLPYYEWNPVGENMGETLLLNF